MAAAIGSYRAALVLDPKNAVARQELTELLAEEGKHQEVAELFEKIGAAEVDPAAASVAFVRAAEVWEGRLGDDEHAQQAYAQALAVSPLDLASWDGLARIAERRGALRELEAAYRLRIEREVTRGTNVLSLRFALGGAPRAARRRPADGRRGRLDEVLAEAPTHAHALRLAEYVNRRTHDDGSLARTLTTMAHDRASPRSPSAAPSGSSCACRSGARRAPRPSRPTCCSTSSTTATTAAIAGDRAARHGAPQRGRRAQRRRHAQRARPPRVRACDSASAHRRPRLATSLRLRLADLLEDSVDRKELAEALTLYRAIVAFDERSTTAIDGPSASRRRSVTTTPSSPPTSSRPASPTRSTTWWSTCSPRRTSRVVAAGSRRPRALVARCVTIPTPSRAATAGALFLGAAIRVASSIA